MNNPSRLLLPLTIALLSLHGCGSMEKNSAATDAQPPAKAETATPVMVQAAKPESSAPASAATPATLAPQDASATTQRSPANPLTTAKASSGKVRVDRYTVLPGDNLSLIAARPDVYGDERMWPLLYRANAHQIGPGGLIYPNQVLFIDRNPAQTMLVAPMLRSASPSPAAGTQAKPATSSVGKPTGTQPALSDYLDGAREAFAAGDTPWAIYYYTAYLERKKNDVDVWGELGNVYYLEGELTKAAQAYYNAANLLIDRGQTAYAMDLVPVIEEADPILSAALYKRLTTVRK